MRGIGVGVSLVLLLVAAASPGMANEGDEVCSYTPLEPCEYDLRGASRLNTATELLAPVKYCYLDDAGNETCRLDCSTSLTAVNFPFTRVVIGEMFVNPNGSLPYDAACLYPTGEVLVWWS